MQNFNSNLKTSVKDRSYVFGLRIIELTNFLPNKRSAWIITDQLIRSATSIGANLVEAKASSSRLEFKKFFEIALKSANESEYWLNLLKDSGLAEKSRVDELLRELLEISNMIGKSVLTLKNRKF